MELREYIGYQSIIKDYLRLNLRSARDKIQEILVERFGPDIHLTHTPSGAPLLDNGYNISISHSPTAAAVLLWKDLPQAGIDIEDFRDKQLERVAPKFLNERERTSHDVTPLSRLIAWTAKEAVYKAALDPYLTAHDIIMPPHEIKIDSEYFVGTREHIYHCRSCFHYHGVFTIATRDI